MFCCCCCYCCTVHVIRRVFNIFSTKELVGFEVGIQLFLSFASKAFIKHLKCWVCSDLQRGVFAREFDNANTLLICDVCSSSTNHITTIFRKKSLHLKLHIIGLFTHFLDSQDLKIFTNIYPILLLLLLFKLTF